MCFELGERTYHFNCMLWNKPSTVLHSYHLLSTSRVFHSPKQRPFKWGLYSVACSQEDRRPQSKQDHSKMMCHCMKSPGWFQAWLDLGSKQEHPAKALLPFDFCLLEHWRLPSCSLCSHSQAAIGISSIGLLIKPSEKTDFITKNTGISQDWSPLA